jgi:hypothetical protein
MNLYSRDFKEDTRQQIVDHCLKLNGRTDRYEMKTNGIVFTYEKDHPALCLHNEVYIINQFFVSVYRPLEQIVPEVKAPLTPPHS